MKKIIYLALILMPFGAVSQEDSLAQALMEQGLNLMVIEPGEDPNGAQSRPCGTFVVNVNACCHVYQVICSGEVKWQSQAFCNPGCIPMTINWTTISSTMYTSLIIPTPENPFTESIPFDLSLIVDRGSLTEGEYRELLGKYNNFYFEVEDDILVGDGGSYILLKSGNYTINQGEMVIKCYFTTY